MKECILYDKNNKAIDWYDPIVDVVKTESGIDIHHESGTIYSIPKRQYDHYAINGDEE